MKKEIIAIIFQEGSKFLSEFIRSRPIKQQEITREPPELHKENTTIERGKATSVEAGCIPCALGHLGTCSGLLNESMRFARKDGISSTEVIDRINICVDEISSLERVDLRPEMVVDLPAWEKELANKALTESRNIRHNLERISTTNDLERIAADTQKVRQEIGRAWFKERLAIMPKEEKAKLAEKAIEKLEEG